MVMIDFVRVLASSGVILLLPATTTTTILQPAAATSSKLMDACATEISSCLGAETCISCLSATLEYSAEIDACNTVQASEASRGTSPSCGSLMADACCLGDVFEEEVCLEDVAFVDYWICFLGTRGCSYDGMTCEDVESQQ